MSKNVFVLALLTFSLFTASAQSDRYFPPRGADWMQKDPVDLGMNAEELDRAVTYAQTHEYSGATDLRQAILKGLNGSLITKSSDRLNGGEDPRE